MLLNYISGKNEFNLVKICHRKRISLNNVQTAFKRVSTQIFQDDAQKKEKNQNSLTKLFNICEKTISFNNLEEMETEKSVDMRTIKKKRKCQV